MATKLVIEQGQDFSLRELASAAGTSTTSIYTLFGGRDGLELALFERSFAIFGNLVENCDKDQKPYDYLLSLCDAYRKFATEHPAAYRLVFAGRLKFEPVETDEPGLFEGLPSPTTNGLKVYEVFIKAMARCQEINLVDPEFETYVLVDLLWCQLHGIANLDQAGYVRSKDDTEQRFKLGVRAIVQGMKTLHDA